tara:strand:- start:374 stop:1519 length:1146 start_codon:yes stop_codon:yes gene_type:complete
MSGNNFTCRDKYYNYGSYLRSRGYDKEICSLVTDIENGNIPIGPITPGSCPNPTIIEGNVTITTCDGLSDTGILRVNGGTIGTSTSASPLSDAEKYGLQVKKGAYISGPIIQTSVDCSHNNYFSAGNHIFNDPSMGCLSTNVIVHGDISANHFIGDISSSEITQLINDVVDLSGVVYDLSSIIQNYDISFSTQDLSATNLNVTSNINFTQNPIITNDISGTPRTLVNFGETITILDASANAGSPGQQDISFNILYTNIDNSSAIFQDSKIDFSNNQAYFENSILEVSYSVKAEFSNNTDAMTVSFKEVGGGSTELFLDTRSIKKNLGERTICFGPQTFIFKDGYLPDNNYIEKQWTLNYDISGGTIGTSDGRLTIKQKSLV